jgi:hypothetical protein
MITKILASRWLPWSLSLALVVFGLLSQRQVNWEKVSKQNAEAALDTTRSISTKQGEVYARLLAQKDVELAGALASAAHQRGSKPVAQVGVVTKPRGVDTAATHLLPGANETDPGVRGSAVRSDSLVLKGPPVVGTVAVLVDTSAIHWTAKLRPSPVPLSLSVGCGKSGPELTASGPDWVETEIKPGQIDPKVCNPPGTKFWTGVKWGGGVALGSVVLLKILIGVIK